MSLAEQAPARGPMEEFRRLELKFIVAPARAGLVRSWLQHVSEPPSDFPAGVVTSCYYDTPEWDSYFASADGDFEKRKVRLRWYDDVPPREEAAAFLEVKEKEGFETWKRRSRLVVRAAGLRELRLNEALPAPALDEALAALGVFDAKALRPAVVVRYQRDRFVEPLSGLRLSLDTEIRACAVGPRAGWPPVRLRSCVLELKGGVGALPPRLRGVKRFAELWSAHSKYALAVESLVGVMGAGGPR